MLYPLPAGVLALLLLCLSAWELRKPSAVAKLTGFSWSAFGVGFGSLALMLYITTGASWPLRGNHLLGALGTLLLGLTVLGIVTGIVLLLTVRTKAKGEQEMVTKPIVQTSKGVWPPPPTGR